MAFRAKRRSETKREGREPLSEKPIIERHVTSDPSGGPLGADPVATSRAHASSVTTKTLRNSDASPDASPSRRQGEGYPPKPGTARSAARKGFWIGVLTFLVLAAVDWLTGPTFAPTESLTLGATLLYAAIGIVIGLGVKQIDLARHGSGERQTA